MRIDAKGDVRINQAQARRVLTGAQSDAAKMLRTTARQVQNSAKLKAPVDTGRLRDIGHRITPVEVKGGVLTVSVENQQPYAAAVHEGVQARIIRPRTKKFLVFPGADGKPVSAKQVSQKARPARPWLRNALRQVAGPRGFRVTPD